MRSSTLSLIAVLSLAACNAELPHEAPFDSESPLAKQQKASVSGAVRLASETDFSQVSVHLRGPAAYETSTLEDGSYIFTGMLPGSYKATFELRGFQSQNFTVLLGIGETVVLDDVLLAPKEAVLSGKATAKLLSGTTLVDTGGVNVTASRIRSARQVNGAPGFRPLADATSSTQTISSTIISSSDGDYSLSLPAGEYQLSYSKDGAGEFDGGTYIVTGEEAFLVAEPVEILPLTGFFKIAGTAIDGESYAYTQTSDVTLEIHAWSTVSTRLGLSADGTADTCGGYETVPYTVLQPFTLTVEGSATVCVVFVGLEGRASQPVVNSIIYDKTAPTQPSLRINQGAAYSSSNIVTLELGAFDNLSGLVSMQVGTDAAFTGAVTEDFAPSKVISLLNGEGSYTLYARFADRAGNWSQSVAANIIHDQTPPTTGAPAVTINDGSLFARERTVALYLDVSGAGEMQISESLGFAGSLWLPVTSATNWTLSTSDNLKTIYVRYRDGAGNTAGPFSASVNLDTQAPEQPYVRIGNDSGYARTTNVPLTLSATGGPAYYRVATDGVLDNKAWQPFTTSTTVGLGTAADGPRTVMAHFKDVAGNISQIASAQTLLDRAVPSSTVLRINDGHLYTNDNQGLVTLTLGAVDTGSGLTTIGIAGSVTELTSAPLLPYEPTKLYTLPTKDVEGWKQLYASFYDKAGNFSAPVSTYIKLDRTAPAAQITLPNGNLSRTNLLPVSIDADDDTEFMLLSNDAQFASAAWQPYQQDIVWTFLAGQGPRSLHVKLKDFAGNISDPYAVGVTLDSLAPGVNHAAALTVNDTLVWDHYGPGVTGYVVRLYNQGTLVSEAFTTATSKQVGAVAPGYSVTALYDDGVASNASYPPGYHVPQVSAYVSATLSPGPMATLRRFATAYGITVTDSACAGQVHLQQDSIWSNSGDACGLGSAVYFQDANPWGQTPPSFTAGVNGFGGNPFTGLAIDVSGAPIGWPRRYGVELANVPGPQQWPGTSNPQVWGGTLAMESAYDPATRSGTNFIDWTVPFDALARQDNATFAVGPESGITGINTYINSGTYAFAATGQLAGVWAADVTIRQDWRAHVTMNSLWDGNYTYGGSQPGTVDMPWMWQAEIVGNTVSLSDAYYTCYWNWWDGSVDCGWYGKRFDIDTAAGTVAYTNKSSWWWSSQEDFTVFGADGNRVYRLPIMPGSTGTLSWTSESDRPGFAALLKRMIEREAAPVRVRGTGSPVLTSNVDDAVAMKISYTGDFTDGTWQSYAGAVTLPQGVTSVWVRYRDAAGNETEPQQIAITAAAQAPRIDQVLLTGQNGAAGFAITPQVTATIVGAFPAGSRVRYAETDDFADDAWHTLDQNGSFQLTLPSTPGRYSYWFWVADASNNFSIPVQASVLYDGTPPQAEFSVQAAGPGAIKVQGRWTLSTSPYTPSLEPANLVLQDLNGFTYLNFMFPLYGSESSWVQYDPSAACLVVYYTYRVCPFKLVEGRGYTVEYDDSDTKGLFVFRSTDLYDSPITAAVELHSSGLVRLSYWPTGARVSLRGGIDDVYSPFSGWSYAQGNGSVEYQPNKAQISFVVRSDQDTNFTFSPEPCNDPWSCPVWQYVPVADRGWTEFTGTAYSGGGAAGRITTRKVFIDSQDVQPPARRSAVPISDSRYWATWDQDTGSDSRNYFVNGRSAGASDLVAGIPGGSPIEYGSPGAGRVWLAPESNLYLEQTAALTSSGTPVKADFINGLLYGADGSTWDLTVPHKPTPVRVNSGYWPYTGSSAARWRNTLWAQNGRWDISSPENPVYQGQAGEQGHIHAAYRGRVYQVAGGLLKIYDGASGILNNTIDPGVVLTGPMLQRGRYLWVGTASSTVLFNLSVMDSPTFVNFGSSMYTTFEGGIQNFHAAPAVGLGPYLFGVASGHVLPSLAGVAGNPWSINANSLEAAGAWVYAPGDSQMLVAQASHSLPGAVGEQVTSINRFAADAQFLYTCKTVDGTNDIIAWHNHQWTQQGTVRGACDTLHPEFPILYVGSQRFVYENGFFTAAPLNGFENNNASNQPAPSGTGYVYQNRWMPRAGAFATLDRECNSLLSDQNLLLCTAWDANANLFKVYAGTTDYLEYSGAVSAAVSIPLHTYIDDGTQVQSARDGFLTSDTGIWRAYSLNRVERISTLTGVTLIGGGLATDNQGGLYRLYDDQVVKVATFPNMQQVNVTPDGDVWGFKNDGSRVLSTRWGPAAPQLRYVVAQAPGATGLVAAGGYVYLAGAGSAFVRIGPVVKMAEFNGEQGLVERRENTWTLRNPGLEPVATATSGSGMQLSDLCNQVSLNPPFTLSGTSSLCNVTYGGATVDQLFEGDLGSDWLGVQSVDSFSGGGSYIVRTVVADESNRVYAAANEGFGTFMDTYDPGDGALSYGGAGQWITLGGGVVNEGVVDQGMIVVSIDSDIRAFDSADHLLKWTQTQAGIVRLAAGAGFTAYGDGSIIYVRDTLTGNPVAQCSIPHTDFTVTARRWGGALHPVAYVANGDQLQVLSLNDCTVFFATTPNPGVSITGVSVYANLLLLGYGNDGLWLVNIEAFPKTGAITQLRGRYGANRGVIVGGFVYTVGGPGTYPQIFQLQ